MPAKKSVYIETSIISYLGARPSRDIIMAAHQELTRQWWETERHKFDLFIGQLVLEEASRGDKNASKRRLDALDGIPLLTTSNKTGLLVESFTRRHALPLEAAADALHVAMAATSGVNYLLTWNCRHIANARRLGLIQETIRQHGLEPPKYVRWKKC